MRPILFAILPLLLWSASAFAEKSCTKEENQVLGHQAFGALPVPVHSMGKDAPDEWIGQGILTCFFDGGPDQSSPENAFTSAFQSALCDQPKGYSDVFSWDDKVYLENYGKVFADKIRAKYSRLKRTAVVTLPNPEDKSFNDYCIDVTGTTKAGTDVKMMTIILRCTRVSGTTDCYMTDTCKAGYRPAQLKTQPTGYNCPAEEF